jgi:hypothetical protein
MFFTKIDAKLMMLTQWFVRQMELFTFLKRKGIFILLFAIVTYADLSMMNLSVLLFVGKKVSLNFSLIFIVIECSIAGYAFKLWKYFRYQFILQDTLKEKQKNIELSSLRLKKLILGLVFSAVFFFFELQRLLINSEDSTLVSYSNFGKVLCVIYIFLMLGCYVLSASSVTDQEKKKLKANKLARKMKR